MAVVDTQVQTPASKKIPAPAREHDLLVQRAAKWLRARGAQVVFKELVSANTEIPDVIGWRTVWGPSCLIECKVTRGDFLADQNKGFRKHPESGMGQYRYYLCTPGLIKPEELPAKWGLLYALPKQIRLIVGQDPSAYDRDRAFRFERDAEAEMRMLMSALRRLQVHHGTAIVDEWVHMNYQDRRELLNSKG